MFRFLIVDDAPHALEQLEALVAESFPECHVDTAAAVDSALECIESVAARKQCYDAAVLDFKLPQTAGGFPEITESICVKIRDTMSNTLVAHISAYPDDPRVHQHYSSVGVNPNDPRVPLISKLDLDWPNQLLVRMKSYLFGTRIEAHLDSLFGRSEPAARGPMGRRIGGGRARRGGCLTHELAALSRDIEGHWDDIDDLLKQRIQQIFYVNTEGKRTRVSLLVRRAGEE